MENRPNSDFVWTDTFEIDEVVLKAFNTNGYVMLRGLFDGEEVDKLRQALESDEGVLKHNYGRDDGAGRRTKVVLWNQPGNDITGIIAKSEKMAGTFEKLLGGEVYHYHSKVILKEARSGGQHVWHQDYGYWYENACMYPNMGTVWVAVDRASSENGCVQLLSGSHLLGRVDHVRVGDQAGADPERVRQAMKICPLVYAECQPGDAFFFHSNVLHRSDQNSSDRRRWGFLVAYNRADNDPMVEHHHPKYTPLTKVPNSAIKACNTITSTEGKDFFLGPSADYSLDRVTERTA